MVSAYRADALRDPTTELKELFTLHSLASDFPMQVTHHFSNVFGSDEAFAEVCSRVFRVFSILSHLYSQIPTLDVRNPPESYQDRSLVRFRAMVQDTSLSSEMYLRRTRMGTVGGWGIHEEAAGDEEQETDYADLRECNVLWAVSIPGESQWCIEEMNGPSARK